jgi:enoyl-CoA hydratase/carnithine racemase
MTQQPVKLEWPSEGIALVTVSGDGRANHVMSCAVVTDLADILVEAQAAGARVVVLASSIPGHWLEHAYLDDICQLVAGGQASGDPAGWFRSLQILSRGKMVAIAAISGDTSGGGCELGWACDLRVADKGVRFSQPEVAIGVGTGIGGTARLMRLIGRTATAEMVLTGLPMTAERVHELGGINRLTEKGGALSEALALATHIASLPPQSVAGMKQMLGEDEDLGVAAGIDNDQAISQTLFANADSVARMRAIQKRMDSGETMDQIYWGRGR